MNVIHEATEPSGNPSPGGGRAALKARLPWVMWTTTLVGLVLILVIALSRQRGLSDEDTGIPIIVSFLVFVLGFATTGLLVASRQPRNPVGWIAGSAAALYVMAGLADSYVNSYPGQLTDAGAVPRALFAVGESLWSVGLGLGATLLLLLFPDGRLPSARWKPVAWAATGALIVIPVASTLIPGPIQDYPVENPLGISGAGPVLGFLIGVGLLVLFISALLSFASLFFRYRGAGPVQRQQLKWLVFSVCLVTTLLFASIAAETMIRKSSTAGEVSNFLVTAALSLVPMAIGIAILKHRLYDIDVIINRALVYGGLTGLLALAYLLIVFGLQQLLAPITQESDLAVAASTLVVAALFQPLRSRVQAFIDKRFYRRKFNALQTLDRFSARVRDEVELEQLSGQLVSVIRETMEPAHVSLWLRDPQGRIGT